MAFLNKLSSEKKKFRPLHWQGNAFPEQQSMHASTKMLQLSDSKKSALML